MGKIKETLNCYSVSDPNSDGISGFTSPTLAGLLDIVRNFNNQCQSTEEVAFEQMRFAGYIDINDLIFSSNVNKNFEGLDDAV